MDNTKFGKNPGSSKGLASSVSYISTRHGVLTVKSKRRKHD